MKLNLDDNDRFRAGELPRDPRLDADPCDPGPASTPRPTTATGAVLVRLSDVEPQPIRWLWAGWIALGKIAIIDGDPGLGKSILTLDLAARVSRGSLMPCGSPGALHRQPSGVVLLSAEDDPADTLRPRLDAAGADVSKIVFLEGVRASDGNRMPNLADLAAIEEAILAVDAKLLVIDPLMAYLGGDAHRDNEVRQSLGPIAMLAARHGCAVLVVRHLNKSGGSHAVYRGGGSIAIIGAARTGMLVARDPDDEKARVLAPSKNNLAEEPESLRYRVEAAGIAAKITWMGTSKHGARALLEAAAGDAPAASAVSEVGEWLAGELSEGPRLSSEVKSAARGAGLAWRTVERAKAALGVRARRQGEGGARGKGAWSWALPGDGRALVVQGRQGVQGRRGGLEGSCENQATTVQDRQPPQCGGLEAEERIP